MADEAYRAQGTVEEEAYCMPSMQKRITDEANWLSKYPAWNAAADDNKYPSIMHGEKSRKQEMGKP